MIDLGTFISAIKITWIRRLHYNFEIPWANIASIYLGSINKVISLGSYYSLNMARKTTNKFWSETLYCWSKFINNILINNINDLLSEPLWNNPMVSKTQLFLPYWYNKGIISIADMKYENGNYISQNDLKMVYHIRTNFLEYHSHYLC